jgi:hypothetical protein
MSGLLLPGSTDESGKPPLTLLTLITSRNFQWRAKTVSLFFKQVFYKQSGKNSKDPPRQRRPIYGCKRSILHALRKSIGYARLLPQRTKKIGAAPGVTHDKSKRRLIICRTLNLQSLIGRPKAGEVFRLSPDRINIKGVGPAKVVKNILPGISGFRVTDIMGQMKQVVVDPLLFFREIVLTYMPTQVHILPIM